MRGVVILSGPGDLSLSVLVSSLNSSSSTGLRRGWSGLRLLRLIKVKCSKELKNNQIYEWNVDILIWVFFFY